MSLDLFAKEKLKIEPKREVRNRQVFSGESEG